MPKLIFSSGFQSVKKSDKSAEFSNFSDEFFCFAGGTKFWKNNSAGVKLAAETALWAYRQMRTGNAYWKNKKLLLTRIARTANLSLYQKRKLPQFTDGFSINLTLIIEGTHNFWINNSGDLKILLYRDGLIDETTTHKSNALGSVRYGLNPLITGDRKIAGDILIAANPEVFEHIEEEKLRICLSTTDDSQKSLDQAIASIYKECNLNGATGDLAMLIVKHL